MKEKELINDLKQTISRLQQECTEKTDFIVSLVEENILLKNQYNAVVEQNRQLQRELMERGKKNGL